MALSSLNSRRKIPACTAHKIIEFDATYLFINDDDARHKGKVEQKTSCDTDDKVSGRADYHTLFHVVTGFPQVGSTGKLGFKKVMLLYSIVGGHCLLVHVHHGRSF